MTQQEMEAMIAEARIESTGLPMQLPHIQIDPKLLEQIKAQEARIEKLEKQVLFLATLATTTAVSLCIAQGEPPTENDIEMSLALAKSLIKAGITDEVVRELFT